MLQIRVQPRASHNSLTEQPDGSLKVTLTAPPVDGAANRALIDMLKEYLHVARNQIEIVAGETSRDKLVQISGLAASEINSRLSGTDRRRRQKA